MLDAETKRRIDTARDLLVGKVPDPKSQVEQITIALIYKFMDDMDRETVEFGGERQFFAGEFGGYSWERLKATQGGKEKLDLYMAGIASMAENPGIPSLFRDIFKNAFLPYRDPETLREFLKVIDEFSYDHSENLGNAFEYLLSVLGSQGDAGQFRTPRHIIDFIVEILRPQKREKILDPACGTAGFLISAYKYILTQNQDSQGNSMLTPDDKAYLAQNLWGYDISPDMVRLSLVNLYLHGFRSPQVLEYDTLTSQDRWGEFADVILANPPFMSPKGGIKPHKRFSVQSKRSEVLFVDYILEHLTPSGRAGIIVPEGIIFQSQTAYKQLRKLLVERFLVAVVSLPAGVFQPYSGVKTSILFVDRALAIRSGFVGFFKVENDGFGLGAQRRSIEANDLPGVAGELGEFLGRLRSGQGLEGFEPRMGLVVARERIGENGEFNLSGERYRVTGMSSQLFPVVKIGYVCTINPAKSETANLPKDTVISFLPMADLDEKSIFCTPQQTKLLSEVGLSYTYFSENDVLLAKVTPCFENGKAGIAKNLKNKIGFGSSELYVFRCNTKVLPQYLYFCLQNSNFRKSAIAQMTGTGGLQRVPRKFVEDFLIPLPPIEVQREIVAEIEGYQKVIDGARAVVENYRPQIAIDPEWPIVEIEEVCTVKSGSTPHREKSEYWDGGTIPWITTSLINYQYITQSEEFITEEGMSNSSCWLVPQGTVLMAMYGQGITRGRVGILAINATINQACAAFLVRDQDVLTNQYLFYILQSRYEDLRRISDARGGNQSNLSAQVLKKYRIPLPSVEVQNAIVAEIETEQQLVNANRELISRFQQKIQTTLDRIWGQPTP